VRASFAASVQAVFEQAQAQAGADSEQRLGATEAQLAKQARAPFRHTLTAAAEQAREPLPFRHTLTAAAEQAREPLPFRHTLTAAAEQAASEVQAATAVAGGAHQQFLDGLNCTLDKQVRRPSDANPNPNPKSVALPTLTLTLSPSPFQRAS
jgi:hypothetical protein